MLEIQFDFIGINLDVMKSVRSTLYYSKPPVINVYVYKGLTFMYLINRSGRFYTLEKS